MALPSVPHVESAQIEIDASDADPDWANAVTLPGSFTVFQPSPGANPTGATRVRVLASEQALYLFFECEDPEPDRIRAATGRRDTRFDDDFVGLYLDPSGDSQRAYMFLVNPRGAQMDGIATAMGGEDVSWDGTWSSSARRTPTGWVAEMALPWRSVRHPRHPEALGLFLFRHTARLGEKSSWPVLDPAVNGLLVQEAKLGAPPELPRSVGLDLVPELTVSLDERPGGLPVSAGLTARFTPSPRLALLGTLHPDFSQVESDAAQIAVNRRYALYLQEKRLFFLDGQEWFEHPFGELVYTRSVVTPLVGERATLELDGGTVAVLHALDLTPAASVSEGAGWTGRQLRGHPANVLAARASAQIGRDGQLGLVFSDKTLLGSPLQSRLLGADLRLRLSESTTASGSALGSWTRFSEDTDTPSFGGAGSAEVAMNTKYLFAGVWSQAISPGFRAENGYVPQVDWLVAQGWVGSQFYPKSSAIPRGSVKPAAVTAAWTTEGVPRELSIESGAELVLGNGMRVGADVEPQGERFADVWLPSMSAEAWVGGAPTRWLSLDSELATGTAPYYDPDAPLVGRKDAVYGGVTLRPLPVLALGAQVGWEHMLHEDEPLYDGLVTRARLDCSASRTLFARLIADANTFDDTRRGELLLAWERSPGTAVYLGGTGTLAPEPGWSLFAKASVALRR
jgi:hypothetical protein